MTPHNLAPRLVLFLLPLGVMIGALVGLTGLSPGLDQIFATLGKTAAQQQLLVRIGSAFPYGVVAAIGITILFAAAGSVNIRTVAVSVSIGNLMGFGWAVAREALRLHSALPLNTRALLSSVDLAVAISVALLMVALIFSIRVTVKGNAAFASAAPKRIRGRRALHGDADWMTLPDAARLFPETGGIVIGERYRVDKDNVAALPFRAKDRASWGAGGRMPLLCFDASFGSSHGIAFAGSGGFKTTSMTIPTSLTWGGTLVVLDPSNEVAPMVADHRRKAGRAVHILDPKSPDTGFSVLDWIGQFGGSREEDIAAVASWIMSDSGRQTGIRDDFFRSSALQLLTALIADVCLSGHTEPAHQTLRQVRANLSEPEPKLRERLQRIYDLSSSTFVKENVAAFVNMTPETFSGVYANAVKETHWLSYPNYAALVSGTSFRTDDLADGHTDVFINLDLKTLETHAGLARVIIGAFMNAIYNRNGAIEGRALFLLDEVARLGFMRILETARDAGRKYGVTLTLLFQSIGQMRETYGGHDAASKWFESTSWISFAAVNDPETADYISRRCGTTTVEIEQVSRSSQSSGSSRTRSKLLGSRPLIQSHEVLRMRADEQIVFTAGNPPLRCGRAIWFRRDDMRACVRENRFEKEGR